MLWVYDAQLQITREYDSPGSCWGIILIVVKIESLNRFAEIARKGRRKDKRKRKTGPPHF
jgi:hypothetical protein